MCGVVGVVSQKEVSPAIYDALTILQHRGQDAAGIATSTHNRFFIRKQLGLVRDVIRSQHMLNLRGQMGIGKGHSNYSLTWTSLHDTLQLQWLHSTNQLWPR